MLAGHGVSKRNERVPPGRIVRCWGGGLGVLAGKVLQGEGGTEVIAPEFGPHLSLDLILLTDAATAICV